MYAAITLAARSRWCSKKIGKSLATTGRKARLGGMERPFKHASPTSYQRTHLTSARLATARQDPTIETSKLDIVSMILYYSIEGFMSWIIKEH